MLISYVISSYDREGKKESMVMESGAEGSGGKSVVLKEEGEWNGRRLVNEKVCTGKSVAERRGEERASGRVVAGAGGEGRNERGGVDKGKDRDEVKGKDQKAAHRTRGEEKDKEEVKGFNHWVDRDRVGRVLWSMAME